MILPIYTYGHEILQKRSEDVDFNDPELSELITNMYDTMRGSSIDLALSAPQIGVSKRIFIIEGDVNEEDMFSGVFINPKIIRCLGYPESGCESSLSFPGLKLSIIRSSITQLEWYDENKNYHNEYFNSFQARVIQHEVDHLDGILFIDRIHPERLLKYKSKLDKIKKKNGGNGSVRSKSKN